MGTWGSGPLDSDTAEDFLDRLEQMSDSQRIVLVARTLQAAIDANGSPSSVLPEEVMAAAAVVAANIPAGRALAWNVECPGITEWLAKPIMPPLATAAVQALAVTLPADGWFWRSWVEESERVEAQTAIDSLHAVLHPVSEG
ncbi:DUF4259 domain-containing protein [Streptomyces pristinaespiralis]|uniref:DUF4259 domain-containing protein n=1 Tax=Streptomyces pristinaespiralis TaxID=38300 RepID=UPI0038325C23